MLAGSPESLHPLHCCKLHAVKLFLPAVIMDLGLDEGVWVRHDVCHNLLVVKYQKDSALSVCYYCVIQ